MNQPKQYHVVALSGGKDSTAMALALQKKEPRDYIFVCTPTGDELPTMFEHWARLEKILGSEIIKLRAKFDLNELIDHWKAIPNGRMRWCTRVLKIEPFQAFIMKLALNGVVTCYVGLRADEETREGSIFSIPVNQRFPLREWNWRLDEVWGFLNEQKIRVPKRTDCARCFNQRLGEWWELWSGESAIYSHAESQEVQYGHTFRRKNRDAQPVALKQLREKFESGYIPKIWDHPQDLPLKSIAEQMEMFEGSNDICRICSL